MADNPWLSGDCQSNSGCQGYSDRGGGGLKERADNPWLSRDCQSADGCQSLVVRGLSE